MPGGPRCGRLQLLDVDLWRADGTRIGLLVRLRDVLPGRYTFGLTGRDPSGKPLPPGKYVVKIVGYPVEGRPLEPPPTTVHPQMTFRILAMQFWIVHL